ncbi:MAG: helix-turn-helix domain-containing protein, partial [Nitrospira sp.]|nr:helix-turn-helix domain-containing protein [Nitrospira sp.]
MESVGEFFRQVRETKGLTVDEVASKTRIRSDFVKALEDGNFSKLPDQVFARGFVRSYARSLGLDEEDAIQRFAKSAGTFYEKQDERERLKVRQAEEERKRQSNRKAVAIAIGIAVLTLIFLLSREQSSVLKRAEPEPVSPKRSVQALKDEPVAVEPRGIEPASEEAKP